MIYQIFLLENIPDEKVEKINLLVVEEDYELIDLGIGVIMLNVVRGASLIYQILEKVIKNFKENLLIGVIALQVVF